MTDRLMRSLGQVAREKDDHDTDDDRWLALCNGELSADEEEDLRAEARTSESARRALEAFEPLGPDFQSRIVSRLQDQIQTEVRASEPTDARDTRSQTDETEPAVSTAATWWRWPTAATMVAAAAVLLILIWPSADLSPLPIYHPALTGGLASSRATEPTATPRWVVGSPFELVLRPETEVKDQLAVRAFRGHGSSLEPWNISPEISETGSVRIAGTLGNEVQLSAGHNILSIMIGRPGKLAKAEALRDIPPDDLTPRRDRDWVLVRFAVFLEEDP